MAYGLNAGAQQSLFANLDLPVLLPLCLSARICSVVLRLSNFAVSSLFSVKVCNLLLNLGHVTTHCHPSTWRLYNLLVLPCACLC